MKNNSKNIITLKGEIYNLFSETAVKLGVTEETLGMMAISHFLNSSVVKSISERSDRKNSENISDEEVLSNPYFIGSRTDFSWESIFSDLMKTNIQFNKINYNHIDLIDNETILWGQFSRFLPIKVSLRMLAEASQDLDVGSYLTIEEWFDYTLQYSAWDIREYLEKVDMENKNSRGEKLASGFPRRGPKQELSLSRYVNHFCAEKQDMGITGFPVQLGLIMVLPKNSTESEFDFEKWTISFTKAGLDYVKMTNPVIDEKSLTRSMSEEESDFMIERIKISLPASWGFFCFILNSINNGSNNPTNLSNSIKDVFGDNTSRGWNEKQISTYRTGAIGLLGDLGLISRTWNYRSVTYSLTEKGENLIF